METSQGERVFELAAGLHSVLASPLRLRIVRALPDGEANLPEQVYRRAWIGATRLDAQPFAPPSAPQFVP